MYAREEVEWLLERNINNDIEVLVHVVGKYDDSYQWVILTEGILKMNCIIYDHRNNADELGVEGLDWVDKHPHGANDGVTFFL
jgi:hypothetical protein